MPTSGSSANLASRIVLAATRSSEAASERLDFLVRFDGEEVERSTQTATRDGSESEGETVLVGESDVRDRLVGRTAYYTYPDAPKATPWVAVSFDDLKLLGIDLDAARAQSGVGVLTAMKKVSSAIDVVGTASIDGVETTHYRLEVPTAALSNTGVLSPQFTQMGSELLGNELVMNAWIGGDEMVRRIAYSIDLAKVPHDLAGLPRHGTMSFQVDISGYDAPVHVDAPPAASVVSYQDYRAQGGRYPAIANIQGESTTTTSVAGG